ncbi:MAG: ABC transporter substrate-binding protein, partial [Halanaeroarchaeum sp.]
DRRKFLKATGAGAVTASLAGCQGNGGDGTTTTTTTTGGGGGTQTTAGGGGDHEIPQGGTMVVGVGNPPKGLNPLATSSSYSWAILDFVHGWGTTLDWKNFGVHPSVYTDWEVQNVDSGTPDVFFSVRDGLTFNDGESLSVDDVLFTYNYMMEQKPGRYVSTVSAIKSVQEADNDYDVRMRLNKPIGTYELNQLSLPILPKHIWSNVDNYNKYTPGDQVPERPVGLGPGTVTTYQPDTAIEIEFRDDYKLNQLDWIDQVEGYNSGGPFLDKVQFKVYTSRSAMNQAFLQGGLDAIYGTIRTSNVDDVEKNEGQKLVHGGDTGYSYIGYNLRRTPLDDLSFRQALSFAWDDIYWVRRLSQNLEVEGDFVAPPGYVVPRPDDGEKLSDPATQAFHFRSKSAGVPDYAGIRDFLANGEVITGEGGTYAGQEYPGSLSGVTASQTEARHTYTWGEPVSEPVKQAGGQKEIRVNGKTIPELTGSAIQYYMYPPQLVPNLTEMDKRYTQTLNTLGIPVKRKVLSFNSLLGAVYADEDFDIYHMAWGNTSPFGISSLYSIFHSDNADNHTVKEGDNTKLNTSTMLNNSTGYGLYDYASADDLISTARQTMADEPRRKATEKAVERIYLDQPYQVMSYEKFRWPVNSADFGGFISNIPGPGQSAFADQINYAVYQKQ